MKTIEAGILADRPVSEAVLDEAVRRGQVRHKSGLQATAVPYAMRARICMCPSPG